VIREAVILAGGLGTRLGEYTKDKPKWMIKFNGNPLIFYPVSVLMKKGIKKVITVVSDKWKCFMEDFLNSMDVDYEIVVNNYVERENGYSFLLSETHVFSEPFILTMSDHIFSPSFIDKLKKASNNFDALVCADGNPQYIQVEEAMKILVGPNGKVKMLSKKLKEFTHIDTGVFLLKKSLYRIARKLSKEKKVIYFSDILNAAIKQDYIIRIVDISGGFWTEIDTKEDLVEILEGKRRVVLEHILSELKLD